jgi:LuxR family transcriptional regulator, maltose regulon positive regulatory protein
MLELISLALSDREIAAKMGISENTVRFHIRNVFRKLRVCSRTQVVVAFLRRKLAVV